MSSATVESSFQGYISSTHDALLVFECVRRGILPKVTRRLRDDERKLIRSGQVFVFDEKESGIKRWTDGLLWSPSRILLNFLVYRQVEKKSSQSRSGQASEISSPISSMDPLGMTTSTSQSTAAVGDQHPLALGAIGYGNAAGMLSAPSSSTMLSEENLPGARFSGMAHESSTHSTTFNEDDTSDLPAAAWESVTMLEGFGQMPESGSAGGLQNEQNSERHLVGSLTSSYPFAKGGLCKKTISIQIENSTQHLISYYTIEDVRSGRLRTPSTLPEIASLAISPIFLTKTSFRFPPNVAFGPDGIPRFVGEGDPDAAQRRGDPDSSSGEGSSGSETYRRQQSQSHQPAYLSHTLPMQLPRTQSSHSSHGRGKSLSRARALTASGSARIAGSGGVSGIPSSASQPLVRAPPLPHQIGGSGTLAASRRASDAALRTAKSRYEPYPGNSTSAGGNVTMVYSPPPQQQQQFRQHQQQSAPYGAGGSAMSMTNSPIGTPDAATFGQHPIQMDPSMLNVLGDSLSGQSTPQSSQNPTFSAGDFASSSSFDVSQIGQSQQPQTQPAFLYGSQSGSLSAGGSQPISPYPYDATNAGNNASSRPSTHAGVGSQQYMPQDAQRSQVAARPHTASTQFGRPLSEQGPLLHASAQDTLRRAVASTGWEPMAPSTYQGSIFHQPSNAYTHDHQSASVLRSIGSPPAFNNARSSASSGPTQGEWGQAVQGQPSASQFVPAFDLQAGGFSTHSVSDASFNGQNVTSAAQQQYQQQQWPSNFGIGASGPFASTTHSQQQHSIPGVFPFQSQQHSSLGGVQQVPQQQQQQRDLYASSAAGILPSGMPSGSLPQWQAHEGPTSSTPHAVPLKTHNSAQQQQQQQQQHQHQHQHQHQQ